MILQRTKKLLALFFLIASSQAFSFGCGESDDYKYFLLTNETEVDLFFMFYNGSDSLPEESDYELWSSGNFKLEAGKTLLFCTRFSHLRVSQTMNSVMSSKDLQTADSTNSLVQGCLEGTENSNLCYGVTELAGYTRYKFSFFEGSDDVIFDQDSAPLTQDMRTLAKTRATKIE